MPRVWGDPEGEISDACDEIVAKGELVMKGISLRDAKRGVQSHVAFSCVWDDERSAPGRDKPQSRDRQGISRTLEP